MLCHLPLELLFSFMVFLFFSFSLGWGILSISNVKYFHYRMLLTLHLWLDLCSCSGIFFYPVKKASDVSLTVPAYFWIFVLPLFISPYLWFLPSPHLPLLGYDLSALLPVYIVQLQHFLSALSVLKCY